MTPLAHKGIYQNAITREARPHVDGKLELQKIRREVLALSDLAQKIVKRIDVLITQQGQKIA